MILNGIRVLFNRRNYYAKGEPRVEIILTKPVGLELDVMT
jgi:hypothetical protein